jgi:DNA-binding transcriptional LysR family regulator
MDKLQCIHTFCTVVEEGSFVAAADKLATSKAAVSRHVNQLEDHLGARLLQRTTRRLSLTDEGTLFYSRSRELLSALQEAEAELGQRSTVARGKLRINAPVSFGISHLAHLWGDFMKLHPQVELDITLSDRVVDLVDEGFDMAVRIASLPSSTLISRRLASARIVPCASPEYLHQHGRPEHPSELSRHQIIGYSNWSGADDWYFDGPDGRITVHTHPPLRSNSGETCVALAIAGHGIALQPDFLVAQHLATGELEALMPDFPSLELGIYAVYPSRKFIAPRIRALVDFLVEQLA